MPKFTIDLPAGAVARLQPLAARYNEDNGADLSLQDWMLLHLKEMAIGRELADAARDLEEQAQRDAEAAILAQRQRLLAELGGTP